MTDLYKLLGQAKESSSLTCSFPYVSITVSLQSQTRNWERDLLNTSKLVTLHSKTLTFSISRVELVHITMLIVSHVQHGTLRGLHTLTGTHVHHIPDEKKISEQKRAK